MTRQKSIDFINQSNSKFFTYGMEGSDLGTPIAKEEAIADILNMDDDSWNDAEVFECPKEADNADLVAVAESILDAKEFLAENTKSIANVIAYAENGMNITLTNEEAKNVLLAILTWQWGTEHDELNGTDDYYKTVVEPLENFEPETMYTLLMMFGDDRCPFLYDINNLYDILGRVEDGIEFDAIEQAFNQIEEVIDLNDFSFVASSYEKIKDLDDLYKKMLIDHPSTVGRDGMWSSDLPNFGGSDLAGNDGVWSWDETRLIIGSFAGDLAIITREEYAERQQ